MSAVSHRYDIASHADAALNAERVRSITRAAPLPPSHSHDHDLPSDHARSHLRHTHQVTGHLLIGPDVVMAEAHRQIHEKTSFPG